VHEYAAVGDAMAAQDIVKCLRRHSGSRET
jgi:hypothetical protein